MKTNRVASDELCKIGDYVLATKYPDGDPGDPWAVGYLNEIRDYTLGNQLEHAYYVGDQETHSFRVNGYTRCIKIYYEIGEWLINNAKVLESSPPGSINILKMVDTFRSNCIWKGRKRDELRRMNQ